MGCADSKSTSVIEKIDNHDGRLTRRVSPEVKIPRLPEPEAVPNGSIGSRRVYNTRAIESLHGPIGSIQEPQLSNNLRTTRRISTSEDDANTTVIKYTPAKVVGESAEIMITQSRASTAAIDKIDVNVTPGGEITFSITPTSALREDFLENGNKTPPNIKAGMLPNDVLAQVADNLKNISWYDALIQLGITSQEIKAVENVLVAKACFNEWKKREQMDEIDKLEVLENVMENYHLDKVFGKFKGKERLSDKGLYLLCKNIRKEWYGVVTDLGLEANDVRNIQVQCQALVIFQLLKMWNRASDDKSKKFLNLINVLKEYKLKEFADELKRQFVKSPTYPHSPVPEEKE